MTTTLGLALLGNYSKSRRLSTLAFNCDTDHTGNGFSAWETHARGAFSLLWSKHGGPIQRDNYIFRVYCVEKRLK